MSSLEQQQIVRGTLIGLLAPAIWSSYALFACLLKTLPQFEVLTLSYLFAYLSLTFVKVCQKEKPKKQVFNFHAWFAVFSGVCLFQFFYLGAFRLAPAAHAELINYLWPIFLLFGSRILAQKKLTPKYYISSSLCLAGLIMLFLTNGNEEAKLEYWVGYLFAFGCALSWTFYSLSIKHNEAATQDLNANVCLVGFLVSLCIHLTFETFILPDIGSFLGLVFSGCGVITIAYLSWETGMKSGNISMLSTLSYSVPVASILLLVLFNLAEPTWNLFFATIFIAIAGCISMMKKNPFQSNKLS